MNTTPPDNDRWMERGYAQMTAVDYDGDRLHVAFADGDSVVLDPSRLLRSAQGVDWSRAVIDGPELQVPGRDQNYAVAWLDVRAVTDDAFASYLAQVADEEARQVGPKLRYLRESRGLSSATLAARAQITPQSLSRIELGRHDVVYSTLQRLLAAMNYSLADLQVAPVESIDLGEVSRRLRHAGLSRELVARLVPAGARESQVLDRLQRIFGWSSVDLSREQLPIRASVAMAAAFKYTAAQQPDRGAYVLYAHYLAALVHQATPAPKRVAVPKDPAAIREQLLSAAESVDFAVLVDWAWERGVAVLPLFDPGQFHGACWLFDGRPVIVLKQVTDYDARLAFDLAHELGHVGLHLSKRRPAVIETTEISVSPGDDAEEEEASDFAGEVVLGNPERLAQAVVKRANGRGERLKSAVQAIAPQERVEAGALANYLAWRLEGEIDWWGTAASLQRRSPRAAAPAVQALRSRLELGRLANDDRDLLLGALPEDGQ